MGTITRGQKWFYAVIFLTALLVAAEGLLSPPTLAVGFSWLQLPPLHARFVGAIYLYGLVYMVGCMLASRWAEVKYAFGLILIWVGLLFVISVLNVSAFDFSQFQVWFWFISYFALTALGVWQLWQYRAALRAGPAGGPAAPGWARGFLLAQGVVVTVLALALLLLPGAMTSAWPWPITPLLAQTYAGPLLSYGVGSILFSRQPGWAELKAVLPAMLVFCAVTVVASLIHLNLFSFAELPDILWFAAFGLATVALAVLTVQSFQAGRAAA